MLGNKPVVDPFGGVALLEAHPLVLFQPLLDLWFPAVKLRWQLFALFDRRAVVLLQHVLARGLSVDAQSSGYFLRAIALPLELFDLINLVHTDHHLLPAGHPTGSVRWQLPTIFVGNSGDLFVHTRLIFLGNFRLR
jgi:hypothetical protein